MLEHEYREFDLCVLMCEKSTQLAKRCGPLTLTLLHPPCGDVSTCVPASADELMQTIVFPLSASIVRLLRPLLFLSALTDTSTTSAPFSVGLFKARL